MNLKPVLEGMLFISGDDGITIDDIIKTLDISKEEAFNLLKDLKEDLSKEDRGLDIGRLGGKYKMVTKRKYYHYYKKLFNREMDKPLSNSALEVLAIIAYKGPITRIDIDEIRGISSAYIIRKLVFRNLIHDVGRSDIPGKPLLYDITDDFLDHFGLTSKEDLPKVDFTPKEEEENIFDTKYKEN